ncbi:hypothetical protein HPP92_026330 [Vanilla planifolia]|uniref:Uncharacterized protein n=1 Tax=Vanilla planifolia TaxID=51239 RepID=A0A835U7Y7_VANPL|nr:hypothetical protein HPP92_026330 [Vanilla planifolia]
MATLVLLNFHNSLAMTASLRFPLRPVKKTSFDHISMKPRSFSISAIACPCFPNPSRHGRNFGIFYSGGSRVLTYIVKNSTVEPTPEDAAADKELLARGESTMPEQFRHLNEEAPDPPVRWPWAIVLFFLVYAWRTVLWELSNWKKAALAILSAFGWLMKLALAFLFHFIGDPVTDLIGCIEYVLYAIRYAYASIVAFAPVPELTRIILFTSTILAIAEATVPNSMNDQPHLLALAGLIGFGAIQGYVSEVPFLLSLFAMVCYSRFVKKRDGVSAALPSAALLAAVGEPWVRLVVIASYLTLPLLSMPSNQVKV